MAFAERAFETAGVQRARDRRPQPSLVQRGEECDGGWKPGPGALVAGEAVGHLAERLACGGTTSRTSRTSRIPRAPRASRIPRIPRASRIPRTARAPRIPRAPRIFGVCHQDNVVELASGQPCFGPVRREAKDLQILR